MHDPMIPCVREKKRILWKKQEPQKEQAGRKRAGRQKKAGQQKKQADKKTGQQGNLQAEQENAGSTKGRDLKV